MIRIEDLRCGYPRHPVIKGISFRVTPGEFIGILGPNGSGKTTLILALSGVLPVEKGKIEILGSPLDGLKSRERARRMACVAQDAGMRFPFPCREVVWMGRYPHQKRWQAESAEDARKVQWALKMTDSEELADRLITAVSGGERQRVMMARALAQETPILLLDESTSAMDVHRKLQIFQILEGLNREQGVTVLTVLHDINLAALYCRRLIFLKEGRIVADGETNSVLSPEILEEVYQNRAIVQEIPGTEKRQVVFLP